MIDIFVQLRTETRRAGSENELPDFLAKRLLAVADHPDCYPDARKEILQLIEMLPFYDTYGQTGYIGMGVSNSILEKALGRVEAKRTPPDCQSD